MAVAELLKELEPVLEAEAPVVTDAVGDTETVLLLLSVVLEVTFPVPQLVGVAVPVGEGVEVAEPVGDAVMEMVPVLETEAPVVTDAV